MPNAQSSNYDYAFYETPKWVVDLISDNLDYDFNRIYDLGAGKGSLIKHISSQFTFAKSTAIELDTTHYGDLSPICDRLLSIDLIKSGIKESLGLKRSISKSFVISNPPYGTIRTTKGIKSKLISQNLLRPDSTALNLRKELIFLSRALDDFSTGTQITFIIPLTFLTGSNYSYLRKTLVDRHFLHKAIILPPSAFTNTEVQSVVIFMRKNRGSTNNISIIDASSSGTTKIYNSDHIIAGVSIHSQSTINNTIREVKDSIGRGKSTAKSLRDRDVPHFHSSDIVLNHKKIIKIKNTPACKTINENYATSGDILIARVGSRCIGKAIYLQKGKIAISDCVITLKVPKDLQLQVFNRIISNKGQDWLKSIASGSCAKIITYSGLESMPL